MSDLPTVSYHPAKSDDHRYYRSADISFSNLSRDRVIKRLRDFEDWDPPPQVTILPSLAAIDIVEVQV